MNRARPTAGRRRACAGKGTAGGRETVLAQLREARRHASFSTVVRPCSRRTADDRRQLSHSRSRGHQGGGGWRLDPRGPRRRPTGRHHRCGGTAPPDGCQTRSSTKGQATATSFTASIPIASPPDGASLSTTAPLPAERTAVVPQLTSRACESQRPELMEPRGRLTNRGVSARAVTASPPSRPIAPQAHRPVSLQPGRDTGGVPRAFLAIPVFRDPDRTRNSSRRARIGYLLRAYAHRTVSQNTRPQERNEVAPNARSAAPQAVNVRRFGERA
jgi:hypothetical protein